MIKKYGFGQLNPVLHPQSGKSLNPSEYSGTDVLKEIISDHKRGNFVPSAGPMTAICLTYTPDNAPASTTVVPFLRHLFTPAEESPVSTKIIVRARIPELHAMLPVPASSDDLAAISMYPFFVSGEIPGAEPPQYGDLIYVDFANRDFQEQGIYLGKMKGGIDNASGVSQEALAKGQSLRAKMSAKGKQDLSGLGLSPPSGDPLSGDRARPGGSDPKAGQRSEFDDKNFNVAGNMLGMHPAFRGGVKIGDVELQTWVNPNGSKDRRVPKQVIPLLKTLDRALFDTFGVRLYLNSGFRSVEEQRELRNKHCKNDVCNPPTAAPGYSNHQSGRAIDISLWVPWEAANRRKVKLGTRGSVTVFNWLWENQSRFRISWEEGSKINEPWHWNVDSGVVTYYKNNNNV